MMKNKNVKTLLIIFLLIMIVFVILKCRKIINDYQYEEWINEQEGTLETHFEPDQVLRAVFEKVDYKKLQLTDGFKNKYSDRRSIINDIEKYDYFTSGYDEDNIIIFAYKTDIFGTIKNEYDNIYYFEYKVKNDMLDDVKLIKHDIYDPIENVVIEEKVYATESELISK